MPPDRGEAACDAVGVDHHMWYGGGGHRPRRAEPGRLSTDRPEPPRRPARNAKRQPFGDLRRGTGPKSSGRYIRCPVSLQTQHVVVRCSLRVTEPGPTGPVRHPDGAHPEGSPDGRSDGPPTGLAAADRASPRAPPAPLRRSPSTAAGGTGRERRSAGRRRPVRSRAGSCRPPRAGAREHARVARGEGLAAARGSTGGAAGTRVQRTTERPPPACLSLEPIVVSPPVGGARDPAPVRRRAVPGPRRNGSLGSRPPAPRRERPPPHAARVRAARGRLRPGAAATARGGVGILPVPAPRTRRSAGRDTMSRSPASGRRHHAAGRGRFSGRLSARPAAPAGAEPVPMHARTTHSGNAARATRTVAPGRQHHLLSIHHRTTTPPRRGAEPRPSA